MKKDDGGQTRKWPDEYEVIRKNYDLGEGFYNGVPGNGSKSVKEFIEKRRKKTKRKAKEQGKVVAFYKNLNKLANGFKELCLKRSL